MKLSPKVINNLNDIKHKIIGKKVFIFDLETTGIFDKKQFYKYWNNNVFDSSRIVEIGYYYSENFSNDFDSNNLIHSYLRKPTNFDYIHPKAEEIHGLSIDKLKKDGYTLSKILNSHLLNILLNTEYIISHNTLFDFYILLNELNRFKLNKTIKHLLDINKNKCLLCTCKSSGYKSLGFLYSSIFEDKPEISHRAGQDVKTLIEIIQNKKLNLDYKFII
jgi:DNA polymerase III epsilon subunit-like protein